MWRRDRIDGAREEEHRDVREYRVPVVWGQWSVRPE
jgi:hypothetical protein